MSFSAPEWMRDALCTQIGDPELFYPNKGGSTKTAKSICGRCPARATCLDYILAIETPGYRYGIFGGTSPRERAALAGDTPTHGCRGCGTPITIHRLWCDGCHATGAPYRERRTA